MRKKAGAAVIVASLEVLGAGAYFIFNSGARSQKPEGTESKLAKEARSGAWVDEVVFREEGDPAKAIDMIEAGEVHTYAAGINDPELYRKIQSSRVMQHEISYGSNAELTFNPAGLTFARTGELNPFHVPAVREAINWLVDRDYVVEEIYRGLAVPKYLALTSAFPDYARLADV
ncbi:MAG: ABC transporter substrate-binding protein, partial [Deltaproteobacteria bacterium]|nr:ABC transporter substrate-binding protein [Deltaproteobacteria bacterium]